MAVTDSRPVPKKNTIYRHTFAIRDVNGDLVTTWAGADSELSFDGGAFADATNEATEIGASGIGYIDLTATEMNYDVIVLKVTVTNTDAKDYVVVIYPEEAGDIRTNVTQVQGVTQTGNDNGADINEILLDTDELQTNQGDWLTATGFSTHSAADVWAVTTRTLSSFGTLIADIWSNVVRTITGGTVTADNMRGTDAVPTNPLLTNDARLDTLDADISSRATQVSVDDIPNTAEFNARSLPSAEYATEVTLIARTLLAADYFNPANDQVSLNRILDTLITETNSGDLAKSFSFFYDVSPTTTKTVNDVGVAGAGLTAQQVWEYVERTLTSGGGTDVNVIEVGGIAVTGPDDLKADLTDVALEATALAIKAVTDNIPDSGSMSSIAQETTLTARTLLSAAYATLTNQETIDSKLDIIQTDLDNPDQYKADVTALALETTVQAVGAAILALNDLSAAQVNAEMVDVLVTDTYAEPGRELPASTASLAYKLNYIYKVWRNKKDGDGSFERLYNAAGTVVDQQRTVSEAAGTVTKGGVTIGS